MWISSTLGALPEECVSVEELPPGSYLLLSTSDTDWRRQTRYWDLASAGLPPMDLSKDPQRGFRYSTAKAAAPALRAALFAAVEKRLQIDQGPDVGCLLSGGIDSSIVAAITARLNAARGKLPPKAFVISLGLQSPAGKHHSTLVTTSCSTCCPGIEGRLDCFLAKPKCLAVPKLSIAAARVKHSNPCNRRPASANL